MKNFHFVLLYSVLVAILIAVIALGHPEKQEFYHKAAWGVLVGVPILYGVKVVITEKE